MGNHCCFLFLQVLRCFSSPGWLRDTYVFSARWPAFTGAGFPIRKSSDLRSCSNSPKLFAATYVLHRLLVPRHPPYALSSLTSFSQRRLLPPRTRSLYPRFESNLQHGARVRRSYSHSSDFSKITCAGPKCGRRPPIGSTELHPRWVAASARACRMAALADRTRDQS